MDQKQVSVVGGLKPCPYCGGAAFAYEIPAHTHTMSWVQEKLGDYSGGAFAECGGCTAAVTAETLDGVIEAWNRRPEARPLTLEALRQMDGMPVWVEALEYESPDPRYEEMRFGGWHLIVIEDGVGLAAHCSRPRWGHNWHDSEYGTTWRAWDRKPEETI